MALDFDKYCLVDGSPTTVLPVPKHRSSLANRKSSGKPKHRNEAPSLTALEIDFGDYCRGSCKDIRSQRNSRGGNEVLKRESVYRSSEEVRHIHSTDATVGRKKIELSPGTASLLSSGIIDALCSLDEENLQLEQNRASVMSLSEQSTPSGYGGGVEVCNDDSAIIPTSTPAANEEKDVAFSSLRSLSAKFSLPQSPAKSECDSSRASSPKAWFSPVKNMFNPFVKSKLRRSPLSNFNEAHSEKISGQTGISRSKAVCKSLLGDVEKENHNLATQCSPTHLHGLLKMGNKHGEPHFQFSVKSREDFYVAKKWKVENASTYVYTFHSVPHRRNRSIREWGFKECGRESCMVGQMHVSCQQYTEFKGSEQLNDSMATEFVLQDTLNSRRSTASQDNSDTEPFWSSAAPNLHSELEIAAIIIQVPLEKRESLKFNSGDKTIDETPPNLLDIYRIGKSVGTSCNTSNGVMHVVIPAGSHSFPISGSCGPSPLLDRWRLGGGCDCGGWDMACPLNIFTNTIAKGQPVNHNQTPADLFVQGRKDNIPAFSMRVIEDGKYAVDFHAQLSSLQAFSIAVAILHAAEASPMTQEKSKPMMQSNSLKVYTEEEIKTMQDAIAADKEKFKAKEMEELMPSFIVNPPFSPIARV